MTKLLTFICIILISLSSVTYLGISSGESPGEDVETSVSLIELKADTFDPIIQSPRISKDLISTGDTDYYLVQLIGPVPPEWINDILDHGAVIVGYVPEYTYLMYMDDAVKSNVEDLPFVRWIGSYHPAYKIDEALLSREDELQVNIIYFDPFNDNANYQPLKDQIVDLGGSIIREEPEANIIVAQLDGEIITDLAFLPEVKWIDEYFEPEPLMDNIRVFTGAESPLFANGFNGSGIVGEVKDNGIDPDHIEFQGQLIATDGNPDESSHGTSTFGIVFAKGENERAQGMLPGAKGVFASWGVGRKASIANLANNWNGVFQSNSWSAGSSDSTYASNSRQNDESVFEYDISMLYATGNGGNDETISQEATAKNVISVGAVNHYNNQDRTDDRHNGNQGNKGPTADGRIKPDIVGPYDSIYTTTTSDRYTSGFGGTSGATPVVAGGVGLIYEMYRENHFLNNPAGKLPHASTVKALLIADAYQYEFSQADRYAQGWGLVDVGNIYNIGKNHLIEDENNALQTGESLSYSVIPTTASPLKISLVWTDVPGTTSASKHLVNDLDLKVTDPDGNVYFGNSGLETSKWSTSGGDFDNLNNVENVFIENPAEGEWKIEVIGRNIPMDGVIETLQVDQDFALVASGVTKHEHDLKVISIGHPRIVGTDEDVPINATIVNIGSNDEYNVMVELMVDNETVDSKIIDTINAGDMVEINFIWMPGEEKQFYLSVNIVPVDGEISILDNRLSGVLIANVISGIVLVDDGHGTDRNYDLYFQYLETLGPEKYRVHHTTAPITSELLENYDVFMSITPAESYGPAEISSIENFVESGGGVLVIGENNGIIYNELTDYSGIQWGNPYLIQYDGETSEINQHEITENVDTLYFNSPQLPLVVNAPAEEVVYTYGGILYNRVTVGAVEYGQGKLVAIADTDCLNTQFINQADNRLFGLNIIKWLINARPVAIIDLPGDNSTFSTFDIIEFSGNSSYDFDNEVLNYLWLSDIDGEIGNSPFFTTMLSSGMHTVTLQVSDSGGKIGESSIILHLLAPPTSKIQDPDNGTLLKGLVELSGTASDPDGLVELIELRFDEGNWQEITDISGSENVINWNFHWDTKKISDGSHRISLRAWDNSGLNSMVESIMVVVDNTPPEVISGPEVTQVTDTEATIKWETNEPSRSIIEYGTGLNYGLMENEESFSVLHEITLTDLLSKTTYHFRVISEDIAVNEPAMTLDMTFKTLPPPDFEPPQVIITSPYDGDLLRDEVTVSADITDNQGVLNVEFYINGILEFSDDSQDYFWLWDTDKRAYPDGQYTIKVTAIDLSGNSASDEITVIVDNEIIPPSIDEASATPDIITSGEISTVLFKVDIIDEEDRLETVTIDLSPINGPSSQRLYDDGTHGDEKAGDNTYSYEMVAPPDITEGAKSFKISITYETIELVETIIELQVITGNQDTIPSDPLEKDQNLRLLWLSVIIVIIIGVLVLGYFAFSDRRQRGNDAVEVEPIYFSDHDR